jgi:hypothetical protein
MNVDGLRQQIRGFLGFSIPETSVPFATHNPVEERGYGRIRSASLRQGLGVSQED